MYLSFILFVRKVSTNLLMLEFNLVTYFIYIYIYFFLGNLLIWSSNYRLKFDLISQLLIVSIQSFNY